MTALSYTVEGPRQNVLFLERNGARIGTAWTNIMGRHFFALHMGESSGPVRSGEAECIKGAFTDLVAAYWNVTGDDAAFPQEARNA